MISGEAHCRAFLGLPGQQQALADVLLETGKPVIIVLFAGRPLVIPQLDEQAAAILMAWHGGNRSAQSVCNVLLGKVNPSGRLTASFPRSEGQIPVYYAHKSTGRPADSAGTVQFDRGHRSNYLDLSNQPLYPFGYGLSYTQFVYSNLKIANPQLPIDAELEVTITISNSGKLAGTETVQFYVQDCFASVTRPVKELKQYQKVTLPAGESQILTFRLPAQTLAFLDATLQPVVEPGKFKFWIGPNAAEGIEGMFEVK